MRIAPQRLVVVGGGIAGLSAAWAAVRAAARAAIPLEVVVVEREPEVGGKARSIRRQGWLVECGPSSFLSGHGAIRDLAGSVGLGNEIVAAEPVARNRFVLVGGAMRRVAPSPVGLVRSGILRVPAAARMLLEPFIRARRDGVDESVWEFAARRLGRDVADRLVLPATLGIFAGDARSLSMAAAFPRIAQLEREHGSVVRGFLAARRKEGPRGPAGPFSLRHGIQSLPLALASHGGFAVRLSTPVQALERSSTGWNVVPETGAPIAADAVILAGDVRLAARLLQLHAPGAATELLGISTPGIAVVALGYDPESAKRVPQGFGLLLARGEGYRMIGNLWESRLFPARAPAGHLLMRVMFGGSTDPDAVAMPEADLASLARAEVARLYRLAAPPVFEHVVRIPSAIPQYERGHLTRVERIGRALDALPGLAVTGFGLRGVAFPDAAADGMRVGEQIVAALDATRRHHDT